MSKLEGAGFSRAQAGTLAARLREPRRFVQVVSGPRQVGKTTLVRQVLAEWSGRAHYASADEPTLKDRAWIETQWETARRMARDANRASAVLALDEIQKIPGWSESVKRLWDEDTAARLPLRAVLLGSAPLLVRQGLTESLAGRFEILPVPHWSLVEMNAAFGFTLDQYLYFGGYPGAATLVDDPERWTRYVKDSLIETTLSRDVLLLTRVDKPALLRRVFELGCRYSGQILSYTKMLGQLQDAGNTTTLAHYLELLAGAGMLTGVGKYVGASVRQRGSSPKLQVFNNALMNAESDLTPAEERADASRWGRIVESAVGAHLANAAAAGVCELFYWREGQREVDFVVRKGRRVLVIEVKSGGRRESLPGLGVFLEKFPKARPLIVGAGGVSVEEFLGREIATWIES